MAGKQKKLNKYGYKPKQKRNKKVCFRRIFDLLSESYPLQCFSSKSDKPFTTTNCCLKAKLGSPLTFYEFVCCFERAYSLWSVNIEGMQFTFSSSACLLLIIHLHDWLPAEDWFSPGRASCCLLPYSCVTVWDSHSSSFIRVLHFRYTYCSLVLTKKNCEDPKLRKKRSTYTHVAPLLTGINKEANLIGWNCSIWPEMFSCFQNRCFQHYLTTSLNIELGNTDCLWCCLTT